MTDSTSGDARPLRRDAARNRERLLEAAAEVFAEHGLNGTVEEVARVAGVGMGTLYRRFPTKEALIDELVSSMLSEILEDARAAIEQPDGGGLEAFLYAVGGQQSLRHGRLPRLWSGEQHLQTMQAIQLVIAELLTAAQAHGRVRSDLVPADVFAAIWSLRGVVEATRDIAPDAWRRHLEIVLVGIAPSERALTHEPARDLVGFLPDVLTGPR